MIASRFMRINRRQAAHGGLVRGDTIDVADALSSMALLYEQVPIYRYMLSSLALLYEQAEQP